MALSPIGTKSGSSQPSAPRNVRGDASRIPLRNRSCLFGSKWHFGDKTGHEDDIGRLVRDCRQGSGEVGIAPGVEFTGDNRPPNAVKLASKMSDNPVEYSSSACANSAAVCAFNSSRAKRAITSP